MPNKTAREITNRACATLGLLLLVLTLMASAQQPGTLPTLVNYSGTLTDVNGRPRNGNVGVTFYLYKDQFTGSPLWIETQSVRPDKNGRYTVILGSSKGQGLPTELFASGEARWLGIQAEGEAEQPRVMLLAVPYALKAGDAQTLGGLPASAFMLATATGVGANQAAGSQSSTTSGSGSGAGPNIGGSGTAGYLADWADNSGNLGNSALFQKGSGSSAKIGINNTSPLTTLDVNGAGLMRGFLEMATTGYATATKGFSSNQFNIESSAFNSSSKKYSLQHFVWQGEPVGNNTTNPSASLNLLFGTDPNKPAETGLSIAANGQITFAPGQAFPGAGTISGVSAGTGLTGGGSNGNVTLSLDTTLVPQLNSVNTFTQTQVVNGTNPFGAVLQASSPYQAITGTMTTNDFFTPAIFGNASASGSGTTIGVEGVSYTDSGYGMLGISQSTGAGVSGLSGAGIGLWGQTSTGVAVQGSATAGGVAGLFQGNVQVTGDAFLQGNVQVTGKVTSYNGTSTYANGLAAVVQVVQLHSSGGNFGPYPLYTPAHDGVFRITSFQECDSTSGGGTYFDLVFHWTVPTGGGQGANIDDDTTCKFLNSTPGTAVAHVKGGTSITYNSAGMDAPFDTTILLEQLW